MLDRVTHRFKEKPNGTNHKCKPWMLILIYTCKFNILKESVNPTANEREGDK